jgi:hypothetical protein
MNIVYLKHDAIDKRLWDENLGSAANRTLYAQSWYLDIVAPRWDALVAGDYQVMMPLTWRKKWGIPYLYQPDFTQQLGVFSVTGPTPGDVAEFLQAIPGEFRYVDIQLNVANDVGSLDAWRTSKRVTHHLKLNNTHESILSSYNENRRRDIRKAMRAGVTVNEFWDVDALVAGIKSTIRGRLRFTRAQWQLLAELLTVARSRRCARLFGAFMGGELVAANAFLLNDRFLIFSAGFSSTTGKDNGANSLLFDQVIKQFAGQDFVLDFEGSMIPGIAHFFLSFGAAEVPYCAVSRNTLPWPLRLLKR